MIGSQLEGILNCAIRAPSADNRHRLRLEPADDGLRIWGFPGEFAALAGYRRALALLSLGAMVENIHLAAAHEGLEARTELAPDPAQPDLMARVHWQPGNAVADPLFEAIPLRHANRRFFRGPPLDEAQLTQIGAAAAEVPGCRLIWLDERERRRDALRLIRRAEGERFRSRELHDELFDAVRFDVGWRASCEEGLPPGALEVEPPLRPFFAMLHRWPVMKAANLMGAHRMLGWRAGDLPCRFAPHLGLLAVDRRGAGDMFDTGRTLQRVWLAATREGLALQPMPASALYAMPEAITQGVPPGLQDELARNWQRITPGRLPMMVFRLGRAAPPTLRTGRRPLEDYLLER